MAFVRALDVKVTAAPMERGLRSITSMRIGTVPFGSTSVAGAILTEVNSSLRINRLRVSSSSRRL